MSMNWNELIGKANEQGGMTLVPEGQYRVRCEETKVKTSGAGNTMIETKCRIVGGPYDRRVLFGTIVLAPDSPQWFFRKVGAFGVAEDFFRQNPSMAQVAGVLVGRECIVTCKHREWNQAIRDGIDAYNPIGGAPQTPAPAPAPAADVPPQTQAPAPEPQSNPAPPANRPPF